MNTPCKNQHDIRHLANMASVDWANVKHAHEAGKQAMKMKAALEMVLMFHSSEPWDVRGGKQWLKLQDAAGRGSPSDSASTKVLCDTIREVLGLQEEKLVEEMAANGG